MTLPQPAAALGLMLRLKNQTRSLHVEAESHPFQRALAQGTLPLDSYIAYLEHLWPVHRALDAGLTQLAQSDARAATILTPEQHQSAHLREDLRHFGREKAPSPAVPAVVELLDAVSAARVDRPISLLGFHYVTLGSTNGGRFIARSVRREYGLQKLGVCYLDPWGEDQPRIWQAFKHAMDAAEFSGAEIEAIVAGAERMFTGIARISDSLRPAGA